MRLARLPLRDFLQDPDLARQTDNLVVRTLLWPHKLIPKGDFIDSAHDRRLLREARGRLRRFHFADIVENAGSRARLEQWLGRSIVLPRENETTKIPAELRSPLYAELSPAHGLLEDRSRLDLHLWNDLAVQLTGNTPMTLRTRTVMGSCSRYGALMAAEP